VFFGRGQQQRRQQTKLYIIHTHSYIIYKYERGFRFMVHHHHYNQRPFSSRPPQGFFSFIIITILLLFSLPFLALVFVCVYLCTYDSVCIPFQVYTASRVNTRRSLVIFGTLTQTHKHTRATRRPGPVLQFVLPMSYITAICSSIVPAEIVFIPWFDLVFIHSYTMEVVIRVLLMVKIGYSYSRILDIIH